MSAYPRERATHCRLCEAPYSVEGAIALRVPRGVHYFLNVDELDADQAVTLRIAGCPFCGHIQSLDEPVIYTHHASSATYVSGTLLAARQAQAARTFGYASSRPRRLLEIGCGDGQFLAALAPDADSVVAIEPSEANAAAASARGISVERMLLTEESRIPGAPFDAFFAFHVLEHVPNIKAFLRGIRKNVSSDAVGCIEVPSSEAAFENDRFGHFMADHLSYFFAATLRLAIESSGFEVLALERECGGEHLAAYVRTRRTEALAPVSGWIQKTTDRLAAFLELSASHGREVALWGASNAILPVLMQLPQDANYILVDGAPTKHGHFAPGSHVKIYAPDEVRLRRIDDVIITAPRFFDEIVTELRASRNCTVETVDADVGVAKRYCALRWLASAI